MELSERLADLTEPIPEDDLPWLDKKNEHPTDPDLRMWREQGYMILPGFIEDLYLDNYAKSWQRDNADRPGGYPDCTPYLRNSYLRILATQPDLARQLEYIIGEPMGVHLNLTGWRSTERDWHQDGYLNPASVADWYAAVWIALDDIDPDAGPFEFVPGSHRWPTIDRKKMLEALGEPYPDGLDGDWPTRSEGILTPLFEAHIAEHGVKTKKFLARKGDVLIWHARLLHRGSPPKNPDLERRGLICHYTGIRHWPGEFNRWKRDFDNGGYYYQFEDDANGNV